MHLYVKIAVVVVLLAFLVTISEGQRGGNRQGGNRNGRGNRGGNRRGGRGNQSGRGGQGGTRGGRGNAGNRRGNWTRPANRRPPYCERIMVPMCKGQIGYAFTHLPNQYGHRTQAEVMEALEPFWPFMDMDCSANFRLTACATYLPKCNQRRRIALPPCRQSCMKAKRQCRSAFSSYKREWPEEFNCTQYPRLIKGRPGVCVAPSKRPPTPALSETTCVDNRVPLCRNITFQAFIPNMFWQSSLPLISQELSQYQELVDTGCNPNLAFFLCGIYLPFCQDAATEFAVPCRSVCEQVQADCEDDLLSVYGIHWPGKLQCHRYPEATNEIQQCVQPTDTEIQRSPDPEDYEEEDEEE